MFYNYSLILYSKKLLSSKTARGGSLRGPGPSCAGDPLPVYL